jgi:hypothetical protein
MGTKITILEISLNAGQLRFLMLPAEGMTYRQRRFRQDAGTTVLCESLKLQGKI